MNNVFAKTLQQLRAERGLSQQQLADRLYVGRSTISGWESGRRIPDAILISRLAQFLEVDPAILLSGANEIAEVANVILVDDENVILTGGLPILSEALPDAIVTGFLKPSEAIGFAETNRVDLAFIDIEMGNVNGMELCRRLLDIYPQTNVVYLTAFPDYAVDAWATGAYGFLIKPLTAEAVTSQLSLLRYPIRGMGVGA